MPTNQLPISVGDHCILAETGLDTDIGLVQVNRALVDGRIGCQRHRRLLVVRVRDWVFDTGLVYEWNARVNVGGGAVHVPVDVGLKDLELLVLG